MARIGVPWRRAISDPVHPAISPVIIATPGRKEERAGKKKEQTRERKRQ